MADLMELHTTWTGVGGSPYYTTLRALVGGDTTAEEFSDAWMACLTARAVDFVDNIVAVIEPELTIIDSTTGILVGTTTTTGNTFTGSSSGDQLPLAAQALLQWSTGVVVQGKRLRGRTFLPGMIESFNTTDGQVDAGLRGAWATNMATFIAACSGDFVIYSRTHHVYASVQGGSMWNQWAVMRSRRS
jgi:hypothetical protein